MTVDQVTGVVLGAVALLAWVGAFCRGEVVGEQDGEKLTGAVVLSMSAMLLFILASFFSGVWNKEAAVYVFLPCIALVVILMGVSPLLGWRKGQRTLEDKAAK